MPHLTVEQSPYKANNEACKELIDDLLGDMGVAPFQGPLRRGEDRGDPIIARKLIRSSREALKEVFKDKELGAEAFNYLSGLKNTDGKTDEQIEADNATFRQKASDVQELFSQNTRKAKFADLYSSRVVGKRQQARNLSATVGAVGLAGASVAITAGATAPVFASLGGFSVADGVGIGLIMTVINGTGYIPPIYIAERGVRNTRENPEVTKIHSGKAVKAKSFAESFQDEALHYENINLDYKDLLFKKMTGKNSTAYLTSYEKAINEIATPLNEVFAVAESGNLSNPENQQKMAKTARAFTDREKHGLATHVASFLVPTEQESKESRVAIKKQLTARERIEQERLQQQENTRNL